MSVQNRRGRGRSGQKRGGALDFVLLLLAPKMSGTGEPRKCRKRKATAVRKKVPYARGFVSPSPRQRFLALHSHDLGEKLAREFLLENERLLPQPTSIDDWLAQYNEEGQTYAQFLSQCPWLSNRKVSDYKSTFVSSGNSLGEKYPGGKIYLLPIKSTEDDCSAVAPNFDDLAEYAQHFFSTTVQVLPAVNLTVNADKEVFWCESMESASSSRGMGMRPRRSSRVQIRFHKKSGHFQLKARSILSKVKHALPVDAICLMALTMMDIYDEAPDLFVAGLAGANQRVGVFSLRRYDPSLTFSSENWFEIGSNKSNRTQSSIESASKTLLHRSIKLLVHEVAHLLGVDHCIWYSCCMNGSGHLKEDFRQSMHLCPVDLRKVQRLCGFKVLERYSKLREFFEKHGLQEERKWVERRIQALAD